MKLIRECDFEERERERERESEVYAALRAAPEVQRLQPRQPPQRPSHSRPAVVCQLIRAAADKGAE